jgi:hypothetical protein
MTFPTYGKKRWISLFFYCDLNLYNLPTNECYILDRSLDDENDMDRMNKIMKKDEYS